MYYRLLTNLPCILSPRHSYVTRINMWKAQSKAPPLKTVKQSSDHRLSLSSSSIRGNICTSLTHSGLLLMPSIEVVTALKFRVVKNRLARREMPWANAGSQTLAYVTLPPFFATFCRVRTNRSWWWATYLFGSALHGPSVMKAEKQRDLEHFDRCF